MAASISLYVNMTAYFLYLVHVLRLISQTARECLTVYSTISDHWHKRVVLECHWRLC